MARAPDGDAQRVEREARHERAADRDDERHAPHDAVAVGIAGERGGARLARGDDGEAPHRAGIGFEELPRIGAERTDRRRLNRRAVLGRVLERRRHAQDRRRHLEGGAKLGVVVGQGRERALRGIGQRGQFRQQILRREAVALGEEDIDAERQGMARGDLAHECRPSPCAATAIARSARRARPRRSRR